MSLVSTYLLAACLAWFRGEPDPSALLHKHIREGSLTGVSRALDSGADPNRTGADGRTALMVAAQAGDLEFVSLLLRSRARPDIRDAQGRTALDYARLAGQEDAAAALLTARAPADAARYPQRRPRLESRVFPTAPFPEREAACVASAAMADIALARACPSGMVELTTSEECHCEKFMHGISCRRETRYACRLPRTHGGIDLVYADPRGLAGNAPPAYRVRAPAFVFDLRPVEKSLPAGRGIELFLVLARSGAGAAVLWETRLQPKQNLYTVKPRGGLAAAGDYVLAIIEDDGSSRPRLHWLGRLFTKSGGPLR